MAQSHSPVPIEKLGLYDYLAPPQRRRGLRARARPAPIVVDDWPDHVPVSPAELDVLEVHLADVLDYLLGTRCG